jgi:hypothetical protein
LYASAQFLDFLGLAKNCQFLYWKLNRHVRYIGINAPEIAHDNHKAEPFGYAAKKYNQSLVRSKKKCGKQKIETVSFENMFVWKKNKKKKQSPIYKKMGCVLEWFCTLQTMYGRPWSLSLFLKARHRLVEIQ